MMEERGFVRKQALNPETRLNAKHWLGLQVKLPHAEIPEVGDAMQTTQGKLKFLQ
jgi:hypothetical protein